MPAREFFAGLEAQVDESKIVGIDHSYLFDVAGEGQWLVVIRDGVQIDARGRDIRVARRVADVGNRPAASESVRTE